MVTNNGFGLQKHIKTMKIYQDTLARLNTNFMKDYKHFINMLMTLFYTGEAIAT